MNATEAPAAARPSAFGPPLGAPSLRRRRAVAGAGILAGLGMVAGAGALALAPDHEGHEHGGGHAAHAAALPSVRPAGPVQAARLPAGLGTARLSVLAETRGGSGALRTIPAGTPVRLQLRVPAAAVAGGAPRLAASLSGARAGFGAGDQLVLDRAGGEVSVLGAGGARTHVHGGAPAVTGTSAPGLTARLPRGAAVTAQDAGGRWLAATYPAAGRVALLDLLRRGPARSLAIGGRPGAVAMAGDRVLVADATASQVTVVDALAGRVLARIGTTAPVTAMAFGAGGRLALLAGPRAGRATLVDVRAGRVLGTATGLAAPSAIAYAAALRAFVVGGGSDRLALVPVRPGAPPRPAVPVRVGAPLGTTAALGVGGDGRTAVAVSARGPRLVVVDLAARRPVGVAQTAAGPRDLAFLDHFALVRGASGADVTWVDLETPSRSNTLDLGARSGHGLVPTSAGDGILAPSPADRAVFRMDVMMGRPMVMQELPAGIPADAVVPVGTGLGRTGADTWEQRAVFARPGRYAVTLALPGGRRAHFTLPVAATGPAPAVARPLRAVQSIRAGQVADVRFALRGATRRDAQVLAYSVGAGGAIRQLRVPARALGDGRYGARLRIGAPGLYHVELVAESAGLRGGAGGAMTLKARP